MKSKSLIRARRAGVAVIASEERSFAEVVLMIESARGRTLAAVNTELVDLYWNVGAYISRKLASAAWGEGVVERLAKFIAAKHPELRGFTRASLFRMRQFYEVYEGKPIVAALLRQLPWTPSSLLLPSSSWISKASRSAERQRRYVSKPRVAASYPGWGASRGHNPNGVEFRSRSRIELPAIVAPLVRQSLSAPDGRQRVCMVRTQSGRSHNPVGVGDFIIHGLPRVAAARQPWAGGQNAFGVSRTLAPQIVSPLVRQLQAEEGSIRDRASLAHPIVSAPLRLSRAGANGISRGILLTVTRNLPRSGAESQLPNAPLLPGINQMAAPSRAVNAPPPAKTRKPH